MEEEIAELRRQVQTLNTQNEQLQQRVNTAVDSQATGSTNVHTPANPGATPRVATERVVFLPRERRCAIFSGEGDDDFFEWMEDVQASLRVRHLSPVEKALFILDHLGGSAKRELRFRPEEEREDPTRVFAILKELYGGSRSYISLQEIFFSRKQGEVESLQDFSHALLALMEQITQHAPGEMPNSTALLRDQFIEQVYDHGLRRELKRFVRLSPRSTFLEVRKEAIRWVDEGMCSVDQRERSNSVPASFARQYQVHGRSALSPTPIAKNSELAELKEMLKAQQAQLNQLTQGLQHVQSHPALGRPWPNNPIICRRCHQPGHMARDCTRPYNRSVEQVTTLPGQSQDQRRQAENFSPLR